MNRIKYVLLLIILISAINISSINAQIQSKVIIRVEKCYVFKCVASLGYEYSCTNNYCEYQLKYDEFTDFIINQINNLKVDTISKRHLMNVDAQLICIKEGYGYDVLSISFGKELIFELNGKPMLKNSKLSAFLYQLIESCRLGKNSFSESELKKLITDFDTISQKNIKYTYDWYYPIPPSIKVIDE